MTPIRHITLLALALTANLSADPIPENLRQSGWFIGAQAYTFKEFSAFEAIAKTKEAGGNVIEFFPGQNLKPGSNDKVHHSMSATAMAELKAECARLGVRPVNYGVVGAKDREEVHAIMSFAKKWVSTRFARNRPNWLPIGKPLPRSLTCAWPSMSTAVR